MCTATATISGLTTVIAATVIVAIIPAAIPISTVNNSSVITAAVFAISLVTTAADPQVDSCPTQGRVKR